MHYQCSANLFYYMAGPENQVDARLPWIIVFLEYHLRRWAQKLHP